MASNFTPVGSEIQINRVPNLNDNQSDPDVGVLTDGRFFVAFVDDDGIDQNIIGQFVNADGTLSGNNIDIEIDAGQQYPPSVAARPDGAVVVVWEDDPGTVGGIHYAIVSGSGIVGVEETILDPVGAPSDPDVATLADGRSMVVAAGGSAIVFRFIGINGQPAGAQDYVDNSAVTQSRPAVASFGNNALVVYEEGIGIRDIHARFYDGASFAGEVVIADEVDSVVYPDVAALSDGRFVVVWLDAATLDIHARLVSADGALLGEAFDVSRGDGFDYIPRVAALPDGGFIVTWINQGAAIGPDVNGAVTGILARRFDAAGVAVGDQLLVNTSGPEDSAHLPAVAANISTGRAFIAWRDSLPVIDTEAYGIRGRGFQAIVETLNGTAADDSLAAYGLGETINGLDGDDLIEARGGDDIVFGGAGFDQLKGGLGNDQLFGEGGEDLLKGEDGDDLLVGGLGRDVQLGGAGSDVFDFNKVAESRVGANHDVIQGFKRSENDRIDLKAIDADTTAGGNQAFDLIGAEAFSGAAGELRFAGGLLQGDTNGDGVANFEVKVGGLGAAVNGDFFL